MSSSKRGGRLGRGLANLIPEEPLQRPAGASIQQIPIDLIERNPDQPRRRFDEEELRALASSVAADGVLTPLLVQPMAGGRFRLIAGERRWRAAGLAGLSEIPALVRDAAGNEGLIWALIENLLRADLSAMETADALAELEERGHSHQAIGDRLGLSRSAVSNLLRLRKLEPEHQRAIEEGRITAGHGRALLVLDDPVLRHKLAAEIQKKGLSVRAAEARAKALARGPRAATAESPEQRSVRERIEDALATRVRMRFGREGRGTITIQFRDNQDLSRILDLLEREF
jgi:ParB family chromosome partitioning protein